MTTLGSLTQATPQPLDIPSLVASLPGYVPPALGSFSLLASLEAWTQQDDDAHDMCSLVACRTPLHPGPCKGWKGLLHSVSPGTYHQIEAERVKKANERRVKRIADLRSQGKPIPRRLLTEIKPKPAPAGQHNAHNVSAVPLGQVNQKADLAGGQAHTAGQAVSKAAGITPNTAPALPLGPKQKKPTVAGRGPAFVITQPKVTDTYKLDKAAKITPQEWDNLPSGDKKAIRDELEAIKVRGFGPQQTKADALLAKLPAANTVGSTLKPGTPGTITTPSGKVHQVIAPSNAPGTGSSPAGKVSLGQAVKTPTAPARATPQLPASTPSPQRGTKDSSHGVVSTPKVGGSVSSTSVGLPSGYRISRDGMGYSLTYKAPGSVFGSKTIRTSSDQKSLEEYAQKHHAAAAPILAKHKAAGTSANAELAKLTPDKVDAHHAAKTVQAVPGTAPTPAQVAPAPSPGIKPSAPLAPGTPGHRLHAHAVANRTAPKAVQSKTQVDAYDKLSKADFDSLPADTQKTIRDDLANARAKFLDPKKQQAAKDLLDRFGSRHPAPAGANVDTMNGATASHLEGEVQSAITRDAAAAVIKHLSTPQLQAMSDHLGRGTITPGMDTGAARDNMITAIRGRHPRRPSVPPSKGYSDPMNEAVKAATGGDSTDDVIKRVGQLSHSSVGNLTPADRKTILDRLAFIAGHKAATPGQKDRAAATKRIIEDGSPALTSRTWDHTPSIAELHTEEQTGRAKDAAKVHDALEAADAKSLPPAERLKALSAPSKAQFDALKPEEQRRITDALHELYLVKSTNGGSSTRDAIAALAIEKYTGVQHPGIHTLQQAETDFRAGKIDADAVWRAFLHARVEAPGDSHTPGSPGAALEKEAQRVAEDNPKLPIWLRASMINNPYSGHTGGAYDSISRASNKYDHVPAPRLSVRDMSSIFAATEDALKTSHPIHAQAVKELRTNLIETGLAPSTPWSEATKNHLVDNLLHISSLDVDVPPERLKEFQGLPLTAQVKVRRVLRQRIADQTHPAAKTGTYISYQQIDGQGKPPADIDAALHAAADRYVSPSNLDIYRKLGPADPQYIALPDYVKQSIGSQLEDLQKRAEGYSGTPTHGWNPQDNALKVFPAALAAHLDGTRATYPDRNSRNASDIANYGTKIIDPTARIETYQTMGPAIRHSLTAKDFDAVDADLGKMANDTSLTDEQRYAALRTKDFTLDPLGTAQRLSADQMVSILTADPAKQQTDAATVTNLSVLTKAEFDSLDKVYRDAIDRRIATLPGSYQTSLNATLHPSAPAASPSGFTPTSVQANVPPHVQAALDTIYGVHPSGKSHTMAHQLSTYGALRGSDFNSLNGQEQGHLLGDLSFIATTAKGPSADKAKKLIDRFTPAGTPAGHVPTGAIVPPANAVTGQVRYATPLKGLAKAKDSGKSGDGWISLPGGGRVWGAHGAAGLLLQHTDPASGEKRYLMVQRGPAISDPGKWTFPGGASDSKETPHEGATRETIEELGLKDDVFKDALVHGDHTFTVPNSAWKYTTVAASVPTMIKPNLTTAHARAETSDAKWMTLAEIQALDKSGDLHHPIAGGKLEQNVISLYPQGSGMTLGQAARPGPVTKRQGRLASPPGGRQAPANFNAWPHPHKQSKGKDLIPDKTALDAQRQKLKTDRKLYDGKTADGRLAAIGAQQGFDDTPTVMSKSEIDRLLATGDYIEAWRGVSGAGGNNWRSGNSGGKTAAQINEEMRTGPAYYGKGIFGNGYYLATQKRVAQQYSDRTHGSIIRVLIPKTAVTQKYDKVKTEAFKNPRTSKAKGGGGYGDTSTFYDPGRYAAAKGLDGIEINSHHVSPSGGAGHVASSGNPAFNWLNRSVLILQKEPG